MCQLKSKVSHKIVLNRWNLQNLMLVGFELDNRNQPGDELHNVYHD